ETASPAAAPSAPRQEQQGPEEAAEHDPDEHERDDDPWDSATAILMRGLRRLRHFAQIHFVAAQEAHKFDGARLHARVVIAGAELRDDHVFDDELARGVRQRAFEAVTDFDPQLALVRRHDENRAVVLAFLPDAPGAAELITVGGDVLPLQRFERGNDDLIA